MKIKAILLIIIIGLVLAYTSHFIVIAAIDAPHNESNNVNCGSCHGQGLLNSPFWGGSMSYNELCQSCHTGSSCPLSETYGPLEQVHVDSDENALAECRTCHDPHYQKQKNYKSTDASNLYLAYGTIIDCSYYPPVPPDTVGTSILTYSSIAYKNGWDVVKLTGKTDTCRCTILFPNVKKLGYSYPLIGIDEGENTLAVRGDATPIYESISSSDFAVIYGQYIKDNINGKQVKFFCPCGENSFADGDGIYNSICEVCHTQPDAPHFAGTRCTDCHTHSEGLCQPSNDCIGCHAHSFGGRAAIAQQFEDNSHHVQGVTLEITHCYECHWEANADGSINNPYHEGYNTDTESYVPGAKVDLVVYDVGTRPTTYIDGTTAIQYIADGSRAEIEKLNTHCLSCHSDQNDTTEPFGDGKTPKQYAWDSKSIDERYSQTGTTAWGKYSGVRTTPKNTQTKAYSAHGNAINNQGGWDLSETWPNTRNGSEIVACFDCHNSHGSSVNGTTTSYTSATTNGGILKDINTGKGGYSITYKPQAGGSEENKDHYNAGAGLCFDCHMTDTVGTTPWGYNNTFGATQPIMGYWDTPYFGPGISGPKQRFGYKSSMSHKGGHFGASSALSGSPTGTINGICTPCHDPHGVSPNMGANQQYAVPLLKGTWITSPYKEDVAPAVNTAGTVRDSTYPVGAGSPYSVGVQYHIDQNTFGANIRASVTGITQTDTQFAGLCLNCHTKNSLTDGVNGGTWKSIDRIHESVKGWGANVKHRYICSKCHAPHSTRLPRLMVTNCLNSTHKGRTNYNPSPVTSGVGSGDDYGCYDMAGIPAISLCSTGVELYLFDSGGGAFPGSWHSPNGAWGNYGVTCHESESADQSWNVKTQWADCTATMTSGPAAGSLTAIGSNVQATITWTTDYPSTSYVDYGLTPSYGFTTGNATPVTNHSITLTNLTNHSTYNYRVRSSCLGTETVSGNYTFDISLPPTVPTLIDKTNETCGSSCSVILQWNASTDPDGEPIQYQVEVDTSGSFNNPSGLKQTSSWIAATSWGPTLATNKTWYWRVQARDGNHTEAVSAWSATDSFMLSDGIAPPAPTLASPSNGANCSNYYCGSAWIVFSWSSVPPVAEYYVEVDTTASFDSANLQASGWTTSTSWGATLSTTLTTWYWRVQARDALSYDAGPWSSTWSFTITDLGCASSCPFVYTWNGSSYTYLTDMAGEMLARGAGSKEKVVEDTELYGPNFFVLDGLVRDEDNNYKVKVRETIGEADYFDQAKLLLVDHPAGYEVFVSTPAETYVYGYSTPFQVYAVKDARLPVTATDKYGGDVTDSLTAVDDDTAPLDLEGEDYYTLDFGNIGHPEYAKLLIDGWTVINKSITYPAEGGSPSYVEVIDENGNWVEVNTAGRPQGDLKTIVVDLSGLFKSGDHRIRFHAGTRRRSKMIIDRIRLSDSAPVPVDIREVTASADLHHRGADRVRYANLTGRTAAEDATLPDQTDSYLYGAFTAYGDVTPLLSESDDMYAIMRHGDELTMIFPDTTAPPDGWERSAIFKADVFYKGLATGTSIDPLPFHGMSMYPYDPAVEHYPDDAEHQQYLIDFNTREY